MALPCPAINEKEAIANDVINHKNLTQEAGNLLENACPKNLTSVCVLILHPDHRMGYLFDCTYVW